MPCPCPPASISTGTRIAFCDDCLSLFTNPDIVSILKSKSGLRLIRQPYDPARRDCDLCFFLSARYFKKSILFPNQDGGDGDALMLRKLLAWLGRGRLSCRIQGDLKSGEPLTIVRWDGWWRLKRRHLKLSVHEEHDLASLLPCRTVMTDLRSDHSYQLVLKWLHDCDTNHPECFQNLPIYGSPPTHLVNVQPASLTNDMIVIERTDEFATFPRYAALSYVWGASQPYMTTTANYESHTKGLSIDSLGKSLQDAIWVTRRLGLQYLWIDALCIIQDSGDDKDHEIGRMDSIYSYAYLTLSASHNFNCKQSFLDTNPRRCIHRFTGVEIPFASNDSKVYIRTLERPDDGYNNDMREDNEAIHRRAWTLQEHFMSPRVLLFKDYQLFWICSATRGRDGGWEAREEVQSYGQEWKLSRRTLTKPTMADWKSIVQTYSTRKLSDPDDKLPALSSIASYFSHAGSMAYAAGIWIPDYVDQLSWIVRSSARTEIAAPTRPKQWRAPSWSWASVDGNTAFRSQIQEHRNPTGYLRAQIVTWQVELASNIAKFGRLKSASLQLRGRMLKGRPEPKESYHVISRAVHVRTAPLKPNIERPGPLFFDIKDIRSGLISTMHGIEPWDADVFLFLVSVAAECTVVGHVRDMPEQLAKEKEVDIFALVLRQQDDGKFYRIGHFVPSTTDWLAAFDDAEDQTINIV